MEMEMDVKDELSVQVERLVAAASMVEAAAASMSAVQLEASQTLHAELEAKLAEAERTIASLRAGAATTAGGARKTVSLAAREGTAVESGALDAALASLSVEQRIAVKAGLMRGGLIG